MRLGALASSWSARCKRAPVHRRDCDALQRNERLQPLLRPQPFGRHVDLRKRRERRSGIGADLVVRSAARRAEHVERVAFVEREDVRARITELLREQKRKQRRFAAAGRSDDQRVADVADVQVQTKRRCAGRRRVGKRRALRRIERTRLLRKSRPDARERQQIGEVERVQQRAGGCWEIRGRAASLRTPRPR